MFKHIFTIIAILFITNNLSANGQTGLAGREDLMRGRIILPAEELAKQNSYTILIELNIGKGWHINSNKPLEEFLVPTEISFEVTEGVTFGRIDYQKPELVNFSFSDTKVSVYEGKSYARTTITITPDYNEEDLVIRATIDYQACNDESCLAPTAASVTKLVTILDTGSEITPTNQEIFEKVAPHFEEELDADDQKMGDVLRSSGLLYSLIFIYLGGLALNLTPCVYPLIPITISYFGGQGEGSRGAITGRAILYVIGMAVTYSILGVVAALTGSLLGSALQNPLVLIFIALVLIGLALSMFGVYEIRVPQSLAMIGGKNRSGYLGTFFMGLTVGLIAAPCIGPFVLGLLTYVGDLGDPFLGFWMFFVLAIGLGTPFLLLGIFSGAAANLPRSGAWMVWVRILFGFVLVGMAIYFLEPLFPDNGLYFYTLAILAVIAGIYLGWIDKNTGKTGFKVARNVVGILFIVIGIFIAWPSDSQAEGGIPWQSYNSELLIQAKNQQKPVIMDFYADWCIPCKELDKFTFSDPRVIDASGDFVTVKVDLTSFQSEETSQLREKYNIKGVPTILFLSTSGEEIIDSRLTGYEEAEKFLERIKNIR